MEKPDNGKNERSEVDDRFWEVVKTEWPSGQLYFESVPPDVRERAIDVSCATQETHSPTALQALSRVALGTVGIVVYRYIPWISELGGDAFSSIRTALLRY